MTATFLDNALCTMGADRQGLSANNHPCQPAGLLDQWHDIQFGSTFNAMTESPVTPYAMHAAEFAGAGALMSALPGSALGYGFGRVFGYPLGMFGAALTHASAADAMTFATALPRSLAWGVAKDLGWRGALVGIAAYGAFEGAKWTYDKLTR